MNQHSILCGVALLSLVSTAHAAVSVAPLRCQDCVAGPYEITRAAGRPSTDVVAFASFAGPGYELVVREWGIGGPGAVVALNGTVVLDVHGGAGAPAPIPITLQSANTLSVSWRGPAGRIVAEVRATAAASLPSCGPPEHTRFFTAPVISLPELISWVPLGNMEAPLHTLPTQHLYPSLSRTKAVPLMAPGRVRLVGVEYSHEGGDYTLNVRPCAEVRTIVYHVAALSERLRTLLGDRTLWSPLPVLVPGFPADVAFTAIDLSPGEVMGFSPIGDVPGPALGLLDTRQTPLAFVNPARYELPPAEFLPDIPPEIAAKLLESIAPDRLRQYCGLDYFEPLLASQYAALLGNFAGDERRVVPPLCGEHMQDLASTAQGNWFRPTAPGERPSSAESEFDVFAFAHDNVNPNVPVLSLSDRGPVVEIPGSGGAIARNVRYAINTDLASRVNQDPSNVVPGPVYCFEALSTRSNGPLPGLFLVQLPDAEHLRVRYSPTTASCEMLLSVLPPDFALMVPPAVDYVR